MAQAAGIVVSHAHEDTAWCRAFAQALREAGADVWYDEHDRGDDVIGEEIERELQARPNFIVILSPASVASPRVQREVGAAIGLRDQDRTHTILLVMAEQADVPTLWADYRRVSGPGDGGLSAVEAARMAISILAIAPAHTPGESPVLAGSESAREGDAFRAGPRAPNRVTRSPVARNVGYLAMIAATAIIVGLLVMYLSAGMRPVLRNIPLNLDPLLGRAPRGITMGSDGALWFTESQGNQIGRLTASGQLSEFPLPIAGSAPEGITVGPDGALWFTESGSNRIGRISASGQVQEFPASGTPKEITMGSDGALWFTELNGSSIGRITTSGQLQQLPISNAGSNTSGITRGPDGALWFTELNAGRIGRITTSGQVQEFPLPPGGSADGITAGPDGALWFTESGGNAIGRITTSGQVHEFFLSSGTSSPMGITAGPDGALWFTEYVDNSIGRITTSGDVRTFYVPFSKETSTNALPWGITPGPDGALWFTEYFGNQIGRITTGGTISAFPLPLPPAGGASSSTPMPVAYQQCGPC